MDSSGLHYLPEHDLVSSPPATQSACADYTGCLTPRMPTRPSSPEMCSCSNEDPSRLGAAIESTSVDTVRALQ